MPLWIHINLAVYLAVWTWALVRNCNFNIVLVGLIYCVPLLPFGWSAETADRFLIVSCLNTVFGIIELVIFKVTVRAEDITFDRPFWNQLFGHTLPIAAALIGLSFLARSTPVPVSAGEGALIAGLFLFGCVMRVIAVYQIGSQAFKFDIAFREQQRLKTDQLYGWMRHPSYTAMMIVIAAYAVTTHSWLWGLAGLVSAWFGFQYRIHHEEKALAAQYGEEYHRFRSRTRMWLPWFPSE